MSRTCTWNRVCRKMVVIVPYRVATNPLSVFLEVGRDMTLLARFWIVVNYLLCSLSSYFSRYSARFNFCYLIFLEAAV